MFSENNWDVNMKFLFSPFIASIKVSMIRLKEYFNNKEVMDRCFLLVIKVILIYPVTRKQILLTDVRSPRYNTKL
jgi:hypothetical protein